MSSFGYTAVQYYLILNAKRSMAYQSQSLRWSLAPARQSPRKKKAAEGRTLPIRLGGTGQKFADYEGCRHPQPSRHPQLQTSASLQASLPTEHRHSTISDAPRQISVVTPSPKPPVSPKRRSPKDQARDHAAQKLEPLERHDHIRARILAKSLGLLESPSINTDSSDFDKSSVEKSERTMNARESIRDAEAMMSSDGDVKLAKHLFESALECEPSNMKARIGLRQANGKIEKELTIQRDYDKRARKLELIKQKHGDNWRDAVVSEPPQTPEELMSVFNLIDADNSGLLDRDEITSLADYLSEDPMSEAEMDQAMQEMDGDGSGEVDFEEFQSWWDARRTSRETAAAKELEPVAAKPNAGVHDEDFDAACLQIFKRYDDDGSGEIDASELGQILETLGQPMEGGTSPTRAVLPSRLPRALLYILPEGRSRWIRGGSSRE